MHGWERIGALITRIARKILHIPILRYVDDFFSALRAAEAGAGARVCFRARARSFAQAEHALGCLVRLVRALLGPSALAEHKKECGNPLVILGLRIKLSPAGMRATPSDDKAKKWLCRIAEAIRADKLTAGVKGPPRSCPGAARAAAQAKPPSWRGHSPGERRTSSGEWEEQWCARSFSTRTGMVRDSAATCATRFPGGTKCYRIE